MSDSGNAKKNVDDDVKVEETGKEPLVDDGHADEERVLDGDPSANYPALLTKDTPGG